MLINRSKHNFNTKVNNNDKKNTSVTVRTLLYDEKNNILQTISTNDKKERLYRRFFSYFLF